MAVDGGAMSTLPPRRTRSAPSGRTRRTRREPRRPTGWVAGLDAAARAAVGLLGLAAVAWLLWRGPLVAPISLFSAVGTANGFFTAAHIMPYLALAAAAAGAWALLGRWAPLPSGPALVTLLAVAVAFGLGAAHGVYPHDARSGLALGGAMLGLYVALSVAAGAQAWEALAGSLCVLGAWEAVLGLGQYLGGTPTPVTWTGAAVAAAIPVRVYGTLHNPNALASALLLGLAAGAALATGSRHWPVRVGGALAMLPQAAALPLTFSRGAYLGALALVLIGGLLLPAARRRGALLALGALLVPVALVAWQVPGVVVRVHGISATHGGDVSSRVFTWRDTLAVWDTSRLWGVGPGGLEALYSRHEPPGGKGTYVLVDVPGSADNDALQWLAQTGAVGGALAALGIGVAVVGLARARRRIRPEEAAAAGILVGGVAAAACQGVFEVTAFLLPIGALLAASLAALTSVLGLARPWRMASLARVAGLVVLVGGLGAWGVLRQGGAAQQAFAPAWAQVAAGQPAAALAGLGRARALDPSSERNLAALGDAEVQVAYQDSGSPRAAMATEAGTHLAQALRLVPFDGDSWAAAAALNRMQGPSLGAACAQEAALRDFPYNPFFAAQLGTDLVLLGHSRSGTQDQAWAAHLFTWELDIYREHGDQGQPYAQEAMQLQQHGLALWGSGPLPSGPAYPLGGAVCLPPLRQAHLPAAAWQRAMAGR